MHRELFFARKPALRCALGQDESVTLERLSATPLMHPMSATTLPRLSRDAQRLLTLTEALTRSGSRLEDIYWEGLLAVQLNKVLLAKKNKTVETALDHLLAADINAYEILVEQAE